MRTPEEISRELFSAQCPHGGFDAAPWCSKCAADAIRAAQIEALEAAAKAVEALTVGMFPHAVGPYEKSAAAIRALLPTKRGGG